MSSGCVSGAHSFISKEKDHQRGMMIFFNKLYFILIIQRRYMRNISLIVATSWCCVSNYFNTLFDNFNQLNSNSWCQLWWAPWCNPVYWYDQTASWGCQHLLSLTAWDICLWCYPCTIWIDRLFFSLCLYMALCFSFCSCLFL